nr:MAG TPA: hypothetical protein [Caudoviricetes sp.]
MNLTILKKSVEKNFIRLLKRRKQLMKIGTNIM